MRSVIAISTGEPAGIGPDICLAIAAAERDSRFIALGDARLLRERAAQLGSSVEIRTLTDASEAAPHEGGVLQVIDHRLRRPVQAGLLDPSNAPYVIDVLTDGGTGCLAGRYGALVTAPVQKSVIADAGIAFTGHTEFLAHLCNVDQPVMLLTRDELRVALVTTHLPLRAVPNAITAQKIRDVAQVLHRDLIRLFGIERPRILVLGLNPHAGEGGHLGTEERDVIEPCLIELRAAGIDVAGPRPADTAFTEESLAGFDAVLAMYHDQGLAPLKSAGFGRIVNVTLGLPIVRTSVDHGTALELAGSGRASAESLDCALTLAETLTKTEVRP
jgi:4-hydroxythreonine-4-phosphate dehydrogenase